jgi:predicted nucleic acid-binding protein
MVTTIWGYVETFSILLRRTNGGLISAVAFAKAASALENEIILHPDFAVLTVDDAAILAGIPLMKRHNLNSTDAAILSLFLRYVQSPGVPACTLVATDKRLLRTATLEGLKTLNPENLPVADVPTFLASL